jgi:outer membrane protein OmpA-like peptidoglycan-associated protein/tetratricopeptide (TPR) repeat protein
MGIKPNSMRYFLFSAVALFLLSSLALDAQSDVTVRRKEFNTGKPGYSEAWKHVINGDAYYNEKGIWYNDAYNEYLQAFVYNNSNAELNYKTGVSALFSDKKEEAADFLLKAINVKKDVAQDALLLTGMALQYAGKYSLAIEKFTGYLSLPWKKNKNKNNILLARKYIQECTSALLITKDTLRVSIENMGPGINSVSDEYSEILSADGKTMYFASRRQLPGSGKRHPDTKFDENIFVSHLVDGSWTSSVAAGKNITTRLSESPLYINKTNDILYVYSGYTGNGDIKMSLNKKGVWKTPVKLPYNINTRSSETSFTISPNGNEIYYVSDNPKDNIGGKDLFFIKKLNARKWSKPQNAGRIINTIYDEESVRFSKTADTLWFSSKGHNSIGGFDIFYSIRTKNGAWDTVRNAGYPINTPWDEIFYTPSQVDDSSFYFVSNRSGGFGGSDIYHVQFLPKPVLVIPPPLKRDTIVIRDTVIIMKEVAPVTPPLRIENDVYLSGKVKDSETGEPVMAKMDLREIASGEILGTTASSDVDGSYRFKLPSKKSYLIDLRATGYLSDNRRIDVPENWLREVYNLNIELIKVKVGKKVVLNNILFQTGKSVLTAGSYTELDRLLNIMKENGQIKIEISGHTDNTGSALLNSKLSAARAKTVVDYLIQKGTDPLRMIFRGYGSSQPIADNSTAAGRTKNRRVEFKILEF